MHIGGDFLSEKGFRETSTGIDLGKVSNRGIVGCEHYGLLGPNENVCSGSWCPTLLELNTDIFQPNEESEVGLTYMHLRISPNLIEEELEKS